MFTTRCSRIYSHRVVRYLTALWLSLAILHPATLLLAAEGEEPAETDAFIGAITIQGDPEKDGPLIHPLRGTEAASQIVNNLYLNDVSDADVYSINCAYPTVLYVQESRCTDTAIADLINRTVPEDISMSIIAFDSNQTITGDFVLTSKSRLKYLEAFRVLSGNVSPEVLGALAEGSGLKELSLSWCSGFSVKHAEMIARMSRLESLELPTQLSQYRGATDEERRKTFVDCLGALAGKLKRLRNLSAPSLPATEFVERFGPSKIHKYELLRFATVADLESLRQLPQLSGIDIVADKIPTRLLCDAISKHRTLREVSISGMNFAEVPIDVWKSWDHLEKLFLSYTDGFSQGHCNGIGSLVNLVALSLHCDHEIDCKAISSSLESMDRLEVLEIYVLSNTPSCFIDSFDFTVIRKLRSLKRLVMEDLNRAVKDHRIPLSKEWSEIIRESCIQVMELNFIDDLSDEMRSLYGGPRRHFGIIPWPYEYNYNERRTR